MKNRRNVNAPPNADVVQVYLESSWDIVTAIYKNLDLLVALGEAVEAGDLDQYLTTGDIDTLAEVNAIFQDFQVGRFSNQGEAEGGTDNITTMTPLRVSQAIAALANPFSNNYTAIVPPTATDDSSLNYGVNSIWMDIAADPDETYRCTDPALGAAVWIKTSLTVDELATVALSGDSDDLIEGVTQLLLTSVERAKLLGIETGATGDQTGAEIKILYEGESDTNAFSDAEKTKLAGVETAATADQSNLEIETAYNVQVAKVSAPEKLAGTEVTVRRYSPIDIAEMVQTHGGLLPGIKTADFTAIAGKPYFVDTTGGPVTVTLPAGLDLNYITILDAAHYAGTNAITIVPDGAETIDDDVSFIIDQDEGDIQIAYDAANTNWIVSSDGSPNIVGISEFVYKYRGKRIITGAYTLILDDKGFLVIANSALDFNLEIPSNVNEAFEELTHIDVLNKGAGTITVTIDTDILSSTSNKCLTGAAITILKIDTTEWWVVGGTL